MVFRGHCPVLVVPVRTWVHEMDAGWEQGEKTWLTDYEVYVYVSIVKSGEHGPRYWVN